MIIDHPNCVLFIEPKGANPEKETNDELTDFLSKKIELVKQEQTAYCLDKTDTFKPTIKWGIVRAGGSFDENIRVRGILHTCGCGAHSANYDFELAEGMYTNTLAAHYLLYHRSEVPEREIEKVKLAMRKCADAEEPVRESPKRQKIETDQTQIEARMAEIDKQLEKKMVLKRQCIEEINQLRKEKIELFIKKQPLYYRILCSSSNPSYAPRVVGLFSTVEIAMGFIPKITSSWTFGVTPVSSDKNFLEFQDLDKPPSFDFL